MKKNTHKKGAAVLLVVLFFIILSTTLLIGVSMPIVQQIENTSDFINSKKSYSAADAQAENTLYRLNKGKTDTPITLSILGSEANAIISDVGEEKQISIQGIFGEFERFVQARFRKDAGVSFNYGLQTGLGGLEMSGSSYIVGNVYSNGPVVGNGGSGWYTTYVTGSLTAANMTDPTSTIQNFISSPTPTQTFTFGRTVPDALLYEDLAQSFDVSTTTTITEVDVYLKKIGAPANATVRIVANKKNSPGHYGTPTGALLGSGTLNTNLVTSSFSNVPVVLSSPVTLNPGLYWLVIDVISPNNSKYFIAGMTSSSTSQFSAGASLSGRYPTTILHPLTQLVYADLGYRIYSGGYTGSITGIGVGTSGTGNAWARSVTNTTVTGSLFCQSGLGNNKACNTSKADPSSIGLPIASSNLDEWKELATEGGATTTIIIGGSNTRTLGPLKINGNLKVEGSGRLNITGPIYVTGTVEVGGAGKIYVDSSMGTKSGIIVADSTIIIEGSGGIYGSGTPGSYVVVATNSSCPGGPNCASGNTRALKISGASGAVVLSVPEGTAELEGSVSIKSLVAKKVKMSGTASIIYESGLADLDFTSGPSGSWTIGSWKEVLGL